MSTETTTTDQFQRVATSAVFAGSFLPAHDETFDLAETVGKTLDALRAYVTEVRSAEQAEAAVRELLAALTQSAS